MISFVSWLWGQRFRSTHANVLLVALTRHVAMPFELVVVTNEPEGLDPAIRVVPMPADYAHTPRCRRRMQGFSAVWLEAHGIRRACYIDLDVVIVDDLTPLVSRTEPIVGWKVGHAGVYSGSFLLADAGALDGAWQRFAGDPERYPFSLQPKGVASDQAMINDWLSTQAPIPFWTERDGFVTFYGHGYERFEHLGVGPRRRMLPKGARIVVLGGADLWALESDRFPWVIQHWQRCRAAVPA